MVVSLGIIQGVGYKCNGMSNSIVLLREDSTNAYTRAIGFDSVQISIGGHCERRSKCDGIFKLLKSFLTFHCPFEFFLN